MKTINKIRSYAEGGLNEGIEANYALSRIFDLCAESLREIEGRDLAIESLCRTIESLRAIVGSQNETIQRLILSKKVEHYETMQRL